MAFEKFQFIYAVPRPCLQATLQVCWSFAFDLAQLRVLPGAEMDKADFRIKMNQDTKTINYFFVI